MIIYFPTRSKARSFAANKEGRKAGSSKTDRGWSVTLTANKGVKL